MHPNAPESRPLPDAPAPTIAQLRREGGAALHGRVDDANREAEWLLAAALERDRAWLRAREDDPAPPVAIDRYRAWLRRRASGEPVAYLIGRREFWSLPLVVSPAVLIPRPETERLVELALEHLPTDMPIRVADLGTGSGAIALAIAQERPMVSVVATDASQGALDVARENAKRLGLETRVTFRHGDWYEAVAECPTAFHAIVSNPPYIAAGDAHLRIGDLRFEPPAALASGYDGLEAIRRIVLGAPEHLEHEGWLLIEHGHTQAAAVRMLMRDAGLDAIGSETDLAGIERVARGRRPG